MPCDKSKLNELSRATKHSPPVLFRVVTGLEEPLAQTGETTGQQAPEGREQRQETTMSQRCQHLFPICTKESTRKGPEVQNHRHKSLKFYAHNSSSKNWHSRMEAMSGVPKATPMCLGKTSKIRRKAGNKPRTRTSEDVFTHLCIRLCRALKSKDRHSYESPFSQLPCSVSTEKERKNIFFFVMRRKLVFCILPKNNYFVFYQRILPEYTIH